jgi:DNA-binding CsgD family transcriptional regulator
MVVFADRVASLVSTIGTDQFGAAILDLVDMRSEISHCACFEQTLDAPPRCITVAGRGESGAEFARSLTAGYIEDGYRHDPILRSLQRIGLQGVDLRFFDARDLPEDDFVAAYYREPELSHEVVCSHRMGDKLVWLSLYKRAGAPVFDDRERRALHHVSRLLMSSVNKQAQLTLREPADPERGEPAVPVRAWGETRADMLKSVRSALLLNPGALTVREADICAHIVLGYATLAISLSLGISVNTVATHRKRAYAKLGVSSQTELFNVCLRAGLLRGH